MAGRCLWLLLALVLLSGGTVLAADKLNVLFLIADDLNCDLGCYGHSHMQTPNLDALAAKGVLFERTYCQYPVCSPSRSSFLTGRRPNSTGVVRNPGSGRLARDYKNAGPHFRDTLQDAVTLPQLFRNNGYTVGRVGKLFHYGVPGQIGTDGMDDPESWEFVVNPAGRDKAEESKIFSIKPDGSLGGTLSWLAADGTDFEQTDGLSATAAVNLLEVHRDKPFFLAVGCFRPHTPYVAPRKYFELYPPGGITLPELSADDRARIPPLAYSTAKPEQDEMSDELRQQAIQAYHASISFMDAQVGRVLEKLDELGLTDNTVVVFTSDHGYHMADHGLWQKSSLFENSARVPLIIAAPGMPGNGKSSETMAELLDLYPTLAELCGLQAPAELEGVSLVPAMKDPAKLVKETAWTQVERGAAYGVSQRTPRWRYVYWSEEKNPEQLFDMEKDPRELQNLAGSSEHKELLAGFRAQAVEYMKNRPTPPGRAGRGR